MLFVRFPHDTRKAKRQLLNRPAGVGEVAALVAARCAQVLGAFVPPFTLPEYRSPPQMTASMKG